MLFYLKKKKQQNKILAWCVCDFQEYKRKIQSKVYAWMILHPLFFFFFLIFKKKIPLKRLLALHFQEGIASS